MESKNIIRIYFENQISYLSTDFNYWKLVDTKTEATPFASVLDANRYLFSISEELREMEEFAKDNKIKAIRIGK